MDVLDCRALPYGLEGEGQRRSHGCQSGAEGDGCGGAAGCPRRRRGRSFSVLLRVQLPLAAAHGRDEGGALPAAVLGEQEVHVAFGRQVLHRLLEDAGEAEGWRRTGGVVRPGRGCGKVTSFQL